MIDTDNRVIVIKYIDRAIDDAYKLGYRLHLAAPLVDSYYKTCCPMGAVMLTRPNHPFSNLWMSVFMKAFDGGVHKEQALEPLANNLGKTYRRMLTA